MYEDAKRLMGIVAKYDELKPIYEDMKEFLEAINNKDKNGYDFTYSYIAINSHGESLCVQVDVNIIANIVRKMIEAVLDKRTEYLEIIHNA